MAEEEKNNISAEEEMTNDDVAEENAEVENAADVEAEEVDTEEVPDPLLKAVEEAEGRYMRLLADFENYKRRTQKERKDIEDYAALSFIEELLPILDSFELAMANQPDADACNGFISGMAQIEKQLVNALEKAGLERIPAQGEVYDPHLHEAVMTVEDDDVPDDTIIDVLRTGYKFKERVIRPTVCRVAKNS